MAAARDTEPPDFADGVYVFNVGVDITYISSASYLSNAVIADLDSVDQGFQLGSAGCATAFSNWLANNRRLVYSRELQAGISTDYVAHVAIATWETGGK